MCVNDEKFNSEKAGSLDYHETHPGTLDWSSRGRGCEIGNMHATVF